MNRLLSALALAAAACVAAPASAITLDFTPSSSHINVGDTVVINATITGLGPEILSAFDLNFMWNNAVATYTVFDFTSGCNNLGPAWGGLSDCSFESVAQGNVGILGNSFESDADVAANQVNSFLIAQFTLRGVADGVTTVSLGADPDFERNFVGLDFLSLGVDVGSACVAVGTGTCQGGQVPTPATLPLIAAALLAMGWMRRRA